ncbi:hypothetical protein BaRGS_00031031, partial [Batillaria attramentaria]
IQCVYHDSGTTTAQFSHTTERWVRPDRYGLLQVLSLPVPFCRYLYIISRRPHLVAVTCLAEQIASVTPHFRRLTFECYGRFPAVRRVRFSLQLDPRAIVSHFHVTPENPLRHRDEHGKLEQISQTMRCIRHAGRLHSQSSAEAHFVLQPMPLILQHPHDRPLALSSAFTVTDATSAVEREWRVGDKTKNNSAEKRQHGSSSAISRPDHKGFEQREAKLRWRAVNTERNGWELQGQSRELCLLGGKWAMMAGVTGHFVSRLRNSSPLILFLTCILLVGGLCLGWLGSVIET